MTREVSLTQRVRGSIRWSAISLLATGVLQFAYTGFTARHLAPTQFGGYACALALISLAAFWSLGHVGLAILRHPITESRDIQRIGLSLALASGVVAAASIYLLAPIWIRIWHVPDALPVVQLAAIYGFLAPLNGVMLSLIRRQLRFAAAAKAELMSNVVGFTAGACAVVWTRDARGLVIGQICVLATGIIFSMPLLHRDAIEGSRPGSIGIISFSAKLAAQFFTTYTIGNIPSLAVSRSIGSEALGLFTRAQLLVTLPVSYAAQTIARTLYPVWGRAPSHAARAKAVNDALSIASLCSCFGFGSLFGAAGLTVTLLLGDNFASASGVVQVLCLYAPISLAAAVVMSYHEANASFRIIRKVQCIRLATLSLVVVAVWVPDARLIAAALFASEASGHVAQCISLARAKEIDAADLARSYLAHASVFVACAAVWLFATTLTPSPFVALAVGVTTTGILGYVTLELLADKVPGLTILSSRGMDMRTLTRPKHWGSRAKRR